MASPSKEGISVVKLDFDGVVFREGKTYVGYSPKLDVSSCGDSVEKAKENLRTAVRLYIEEAEKMGTLEEILAESGYSKTSAGHWETPRLVATEYMTIEA